MNQWNGDYRILPFSYQFGYQAANRIVQPEDLQNVLKSIVINRCETERQKTASMTKRLNKAEKELDAQKKKNKEISDALFRVQEELYLFMHPEENVPVKKRRAQA